MTKEQQAKLIAVANQWSAASVPYVSGGTTQKGADCSGSISAIYGEAGLPIGHMTSGAFPKSSMFVAVTGQPEVGDVGWYPGHVVLFAGDQAGPGHDVWSASHTGGPVFGPASSKWYGTPRWYRYVGH